MIELVLTICFAIGPTCSEADFIYYEQSGFETFEACDNGGRALLARLLNTNQITIEQAGSAAWLCRPRE